MAADNAPTSMERRGMSLRLVGPVPAAHSAASRGDAVRAGIGPDEPMAARLSRTTRVLRDLIAREEGTLDQMPILRALAETVTALAVTLGGGTAAPVATVETLAAMFRHEGEFWTLSWRGKVCRLRDLRGLHFIAQLLRCPGRELLALDLLNVQEGATMRAPWSAGVEVLDARAKAEYRRRLRELEEQLEDAEELGHAERAARARAEREALADQLAEAVGLGGRDRVTGSAADRARCAVTHGIRRALQHIRPALPALADELRLRIRTGSYCVYIPDAAHPTEWVL
jgi:hypothetical protein